MNKLDKKNAWSVVAKNFRHISYLGFLIFLAFTTLFFLDEGVLDNYGIGFFNIVILFIVSGLWYYLSVLFVNKNKIAIPIGYVVLLAILVFAMLQQIYAVALISSYFMYLIYKVSKSDEVLTNKSSSN